MNNRKKQLQQEIKELEAKLEPKQKEMQKIYQKESEDIKAKIKRTYQGKDAFTLDELRFAATNKCLCGAGLAYPKDIGMHGGWDCSDILLGEAITSDKAEAKQHTAILPFAFYEIKSEDQPSAGGMTTRPEIGEKANL